MRISPPTRQDRPELDTRSLLHVLEILLEPGEEVRVRNPSPINLGEREPVRNISATERLHIVATNLLDG